MSHRVLIVEDEILVAMDLETTLEDNGFHPVGIAPDTRTAMKLAQIGADIAFVDINLRDGCTGMEIGRRLAQDFGIDVIFTSANTDLLGDGVDGTLGYLPKPYGHTQLLAALRYLVSLQDSAQTTQAPPPALQFFAGAHAR